MNTTKELSTKDIKERISDHLLRYFAVDPSRATKEQLYQAAALVIRNELLIKKQINNKKVAEKGSKKVYYLCMEFLIGRGLRNNLYNLGLEDNFKAALAELCQYPLDELYELESDAGLGNGGLGRLAACFMDSLASLSYPAMGFSIRYDYGFFRQKIVDNAQVELPEMWLESGEAWMMRRTDKVFTVKLGGYIEEEWQDGKCKIKHVDASVIEATPYDIIIGGGKDGGVSTLRLWHSSAKNEFNMKFFSHGDYEKAMKTSREAELISKVLYPSDDHQQGKQLRLSQQYFLCSASLQCILSDHMRHNDSLDNLPDMVAIHINDTHPALAVAELMRLLVDEHGYDWIAAWGMVTQIIAYTNHTVLAEALETWSESLIFSHLPRIYQIMKEIDHRFCTNLSKIGKDYLIPSCAIFFDGRARMANLAVIGSHSVNGVAALHSDIIKKSVFNQFYQLTPEKFTNVTNGVTFRRWLCQSNPRLTALIKELIGDKFLTDFSEMSEIERYASDKTVLNKLAKIKAENKKDFADYILREFNVTIDPSHRFDVQIKRLHEYKRQLMNVMKIITYYIQLTDNPNLEFTPQTFIFGAKAAGSYYHAKRIIQLINCISSEIRRSKLSDKLNVLFVENYNVTKAEHIIPAAEVSEQISLAGKEASGTSNMKFMVNGAITLGTVDGANVEIMESVGLNNIFTFGAHADEVEEIWRSGYFASKYFSENKMIARIVERLRIGFDGVSFSDIADYLTMTYGGIADPYMCLMDYPDYMRAADGLDKAYADKIQWNKMSLVNIARSPRFSSDRSIEEYANNIWHLKRLK